MSNSLSGNTSERKCDALELEVKENQTEVVGPISQEMKVFLFAAAVIAAIAAISYFLYTHNYNTALDSFRLGG